MISAKKYDLVLAVHADQSWIEVTVPRGKAAQDDKDAALALLQKADTPGRDRPILLLSGGRF